jgi:hypothetical protein
VRFWRRFEYGGDDFSVLNVIISAMQNAEKKLLILDLDETLVYATEEKLERQEDFIVGQYYVYKRPFYTSLLSFVGKILMLRFGLLRQIIMQ